MQKNFCGKTMIEKENINLYYYMTVDEIMPTVNAQKYESYGVEIVMNYKGVLETKSMPNITTNLHDIRNFINLLIKNSVTPTNIEEICHDYM